MMKQFHFFTRAKKALRSWLTLGFEEEFSQYNALAEYTPVLAQDNLSLLQDYCGISCPLLLALIFTRCLLNGICLANILPGVLVGLGIDLLRTCLRHGLPQKDPLRWSYRLTAGFAFLWYALSFFYDTILRPEQPAVVSCMVFLAMTTLFHTDPQDNIVQTGCYLGAMLFLDLALAPLPIVLLDLRNCLMAAAIGIYLNQRSTRSYIREKVYTNMYKAATKTSILVAQADLVHNTFEVLQCPDYMYETLAGTHFGTDVLEKIRDLFVAPEYRSEFTTVWDWDSLPDRMAENDQLSFYFQDFRQMWCQMVLVEQARRNGRVSAIVAIVRDVDEEKRREIETQQQLKAAVDEARRANAAKTSFLSRMSHDIRTPLNGILGLLQISDAHPDDDALVRSNRQKIVTSANHLLSLINDVLQMSKLESGELVLAHEPCDLHEVSNDILDIVSQRAASACVTLEYDFNHSERELSPYVYASPLHLRQLFLNIYTNCIKYNKPGGTVTSRFNLVSRDDTTVTYRWVISDTGIGMSPEFLQHIFDPFTQEHTDARSVYQGTGLGMSIVKALVDKMNGTIEVQSTQGVGSTFIVTLPFELADASLLHRDDPAQAADHDLHGLHLLLAEDNDLNAEIAQTLLRDAGAETTLARDGQQAIEQFAASPAGTFDGILMDVMMPNVDGLAATRAIRALDRPDAKTIPILAMTANAFDEDARACLAAGMNAHLSKPLQIELVTATIAKYCKK